MVVDAGAVFDVNGVTLLQGGNRALRSLIVNDGTVKSSGGVATVYVTSLIEIGQWEQPELLGSGGISTDLSGSATMLMSPVVAADTFTLSGEQQLRRQHSS